MKLTMRQAVVATVGVVAAGGLVLGGTEAFASSPGTSAAAVSVIPAADSPSSAAAKAACRQANQMTATPTAQASAAKTRSKTKQARRARIGCGGRFGGRKAGAGRLLNQGVHGQATVKGGDGTFSVQEWQTGKIASITGNTVTVTDASGTTWTWTVQSTTRYRVGALGAKKSGSTAKPSAGSLASLHTGDTVIVRGVQNGSANDATAVADTGTGS
ncbi:hypothetical protein KDL01_32605 [Actinospica durhamensis]|uniref:DUF5666 domain-containing protein n=1 Tax=Actinospica durhamensis TaxID=1508375 RepID=A0A941EUR6_9ACTN|nr:hypothetical protein [Actinospica durhamensis]MBR7838060.1 hypothetical protein [Actinospica durhamensis]